MCTVSAMYDYGRHIQPVQWTTPVLDEFKKVIEQAEKFDAAAGEPDCIDPKKAEWLGLVEGLVALKEEKIRYERQILEAKYAEGQIVVLDEQIATLLSTLGALA